MHSQCDPSEILSAQLDCCTTFSATFPTPSSSSIARSCPLIFASFLHGITTLRFNDTTTAVIPPRLTEGDTAWIAAFAFFVSSSGNGR